MARERAAEKAAAEEKKRKQCRTVLPLLKYFNRSTSTCFQQDAQGGHKEGLHDGECTVPAVKNPTPSLEAPASAALPDTSIGTAAATAGNVAAANDTGSPPVGSKPATAVVIATASSRRINLCRTTLGLEVTSMPSSYEEDRKKSAAAASGEGEGQDDGAPTTGANQESAASEEGGGDVKRKKLKRAEEPQFSDEELLSLLNDGSHRLFNLDGGRSASTSPRRGRSSRATVAVHLMETKMYALRMALGKASSIAQQLWNQQEQEPDSSASTSSDDNNKDATSSNAEDSDPEEEKKQLPPGCVVIGADTIIELDGKIFEKAESREEAKEMLLNMSGKTHSVHTAVCVYTQKGGIRKPAAAAVSTTSVSFVDFTEDDVDAFVETAQYEGKSGSYGILELAGQFVKGIDGCVFSVMGLPVQWVSATLASLYHSNKIV